MKKTISLFTIIIMVSVFSACEKDIASEPLELKSGHLENNIGFDEWGYNWKAQTFNGYLLNMMLASNYFRDVYAMPHYKQELYSGEGMEFWEMLIAKYKYFPFLLPEPELLIDCRVHAHWNDGLARKDGVYPPMVDGKVWVDSDAWIVFKYTGMKDGKKWSHMRKLVAIQSSYELRDGVWYDENDAEIGLFSKYWSADLIVIQVVNIGDVNTDIFYEGYTSPSGAGLGKY